MQLRFFTYLRSARWILPAFLLAWCTVHPAVAQWTAADAQTAFNDYNNAFYFNSGGNNYDYRLNQGSTSPTAFWISAEQIETAIDAFNQNSTTTNQNIINQLCNGFVARYTNDWSSDSFDDDLMWATIAFTRAAKATGNTAWLTDAETNFATVWSRGYDTTFGGGIWWNSAAESTSSGYKNSAANWTFVIAGNLLYQATGDSTYQSEAATIFSWAFSTLYNASTGEIYDGINGSGIQAGQYSYNYGVAAGADYFENHLADANNVATYLMNNLSSGEVGGYNILPNYGQGGTDGGGFNGIALRWIGYAYNHGAISNTNVLYWAQANVGLAWALRNSVGLTWNNWLAATPETTQYSWDCSNSVVGMQDIPPGPSATAADFSIASSPTVLNLTPGGSGSSTIAVTPVNRFNSAVSLTATVVGAPAGISAALGQSSLKGAGSVTLNVTTTSATQGGNYVVAVVAGGGGVTHATFVQLALPFFGLSLSPTTSYLDETGQVIGTVTITPFNGFNGTVQLSNAGGLPEGVAAWFQPQPAGTTSTLKIAARGNAGTIANTPYTITGTSTSYSQTLPAANLAVSAATGRDGAGVPVNLSSAFNLTGIYADGATYSSGGLDGLGYSFSSTLLTASRILHYTQFTFGPVGQPDAVYGTGTAIPLPQGQYTALQLLATGINGNQAEQTVVVTYTDGTTSQFTQSFSDWFADAHNASEAEGVAMPYRNYANGTTNNAPFNLYGYTFLLNSSKTVQSLTLPSNRNVVVLAATLTRQDFGEQVNLSSLFNITGIYTDGTTFPSNGGVDGGGYAYSATQLGNQAGASNYIVNGVNFALGAPDVNNVLYGTGQPVPLPQGHFSHLKILGTGVEGSQAAQPVTITYTDGTTATFTQGFSDWFNPQGYPREYKAEQMSYRDQASGTTSSATFYLYYYVFPLNLQKVVQSITLPSNRDVVALAITLTTEVQ
jgi:hypothetical protein